MFCRSDSYMASNELYEMYPQRNRVFFHQIYSGSRETGILLHKYCNTSHPEPLTSPDNHVVVYFHSDEAGSDAGFQIHYTVIEGKIQHQNSM